MADIWTVERRGAVALLTFDNPPRNLMPMVGMTRLCDRLDELAGDDTVNVVVLTGAVPGYFVAHADVDDLARLGRGEPVEGNPADWGRALALLEDMPQPTIAAVNGQAWGGGSELALACTMRVAAASAHFAQPEVAVGIIPGAGGTQRLPRLVGSGRAAELIMTGRPVDAERAERIGLVNAVLPDEGFVGAAVAWAERIAALPRAAVVAGKRAVVEGLRRGFAEGLALEAELFLRLQVSPEAIALEEAVSRAYAEGTDPWSGGA